MVKFHAYLQRRGREDKSKEKKCDNTIASKMWISIMAERLNRRLESRTFRARGLVLIGYHLIARQETLGVLKSHGGHQRPGAVDPARMLSRRSEC